MPYHSSNRHTVRLSARLLVFGLWVLFFGLFILIFAVQMMVMVSSADVGALGAESGVNLHATMFDGLLTLYRGGFVTLGVGGMLMVFGGTFVISVVR